MKIYIPSGLLLQSKLSQEERNCASVPCSITFVCSRDRGVNSQSRSLLLSTNLVGHIRDISVATEIFESALKFQT